MSDVEMPEEYRADFAARVKAEVRRQFRGNRKAAYSKAEINPATWARAENAQSMKDRSIVAVVGFLWPETEGDWTAINPPLRAVAAPDAAAEVVKSNLSEPAKALILEILTEANAEVTPGSQEVG